MPNGRKGWAWIIAVALGVLLLAVSFQLDPPVQRWQQIHRWKNNQRLSRNVTRVTDWPTHTVVGLALLGFAWQRRNKKWTRIFAAMILAGTLAGVTAYALKLSTGRVRPSVKVEKVWRGPELRRNFQSFPSGHAAFSAGFFSVLLFASWRIGLACLPIPLLVGFSRIFLGAHYLSDVVGAMLLGLLAAAIVASLMLSNKKSEMEQAA